MTYDLLIKNGRIVDGSGMPSYGEMWRLVGKIAELGRLSGAAKRVIDADGKVIAPGFIDNHCHYDAQVTWDPRSPFHAITAPPASLSATAHWQSLPCGRMNMRSSSACCRRWKRSRWMSCRPGCRGTGRAFRSIWTCSTASSASMSAR